MATADLSQSFAMGPPNLNTLSPKTHMFVQTFKNLLKKTDFFSPKEQVLEGSTAAPC